MWCHIIRDHKACQSKLDQHLNVKSMVKKFGVEKTSRVPAFSGGDSPLKSGRAANPGREGGDVKVLIPGGSGGAHADGNYYTAGQCVRVTWYALWPDSVKTLEWHIKSGVEGIAIPAPHEEMGDHVLWTGLWT